MKEQELLEALLELTREAGMRVKVSGFESGRTEDGALSSGTCRLKGELWVVLSGTDSATIHIDTLASALRTHAPDFLESRHLSPALRQRISPEGKSSPELP